MTIDDLLARMAIGDFIQTVDRWVNLANEMRRATA